MFGGKDVAGEAIMNGPPPFACSRATAIVCRSRRVQALVQDEPNTNEREDCGNQDA